jgi:hypothetical protein
MPDFRASFADGASRGTTVHLGAFLSTVGFGAALALAALLAWRGRFWWPVLLVAAVTLAVRLPQSPVPIFNIDEAINAAIAIRLQEGAVLYGGVWDHKPPLSFYLYKVIFDLFGPWNMTAVHAVGAFLYAGVVVLTGLVGRRLLPRSFGPWAAILLVPYGLLYFRYDFMATNHELGGLPFALLCVLFLWKGLDTPSGAESGSRSWPRRHRRALWLAAAGAAGALGGLFREACAVIVPVSGLFLLIRPWLRGAAPGPGSPASAAARASAAGRSDPPLAGNAIAAVVVSVRAPWADVAAFGAGAAVPLAVFVAWLFAHGVARDAYYLMITHNLRYRAAGRHGVDWLYHAAVAVKSFLRFAPALWLSILAGLAVLAVRSVRMLLRRIPAEPETFYVGLWCLGAGYMAGQGGRFHGHYFVPFYPPLMLATAWFLASRRWPQRPALRSTPVAGSSGGRRQNRAASSRERGPRRTDTVQGGAGGRALGAAGARAPAAAARFSVRSIDLGHVLLTVVLLLSVVPYYRYQGRNHARCVQRFVLGRQDVGAGFKDIMIDRSHVAVARAIQSKSGPEDPVFVWGFCPQLYVLAHRRPATRFTFTAILSGLTVAGSTIRTEARSWDLLKSDLDHERPVLVVDASSLFLKDQPLEAYPDFRAWLLQRYRPAGEVQGCRIYERNDRQPAEPAQ